MKNTRILLAVGALSLLYACQKDIEVVKNQDTSWKVDEVITNEDVRTRIGYDPRYTYVYLKDKMTEVEMLSLGDVKINQTHTKEVAFSLTKPLNKDVKIRLEYDPDFYEGIKDNYIGFKLGQQDVVTFTEDVKIVTAGQTQATFTLNVENQQFANGLIIPYALKVVEGEDQVRLFEKDKHLLLKVNNNEVQITLTPKEIAKGALKDVNNTVTMQNKRVAYAIKTSYLLPSNLSFGLVRNDAYTAQNDEKVVAPIMEDTSIKVSFDTNKTAEIAFDLDKVEELTELGKYVLPLKLVAYDTQGNVYELPNQETLIKINVVDSSSLLPVGDNVTASTNMAIVTGTKLTNKSNWELSSRFSITGRERMIDGDEQTEGYFTNRRDFSIKLKLGGVHRVAYMVFTTKDLRYALRGLKCYATDTSTGQVKVLQGEVLYDGNSEKCVIKFNQPIEVDEFDFDTFRGKTTYIDINEIDIYTE